MRVLVLGAGVAGVATAYFLHQQGHEVTVVDRQAGPALETSFANAGHMCPSYATPWAAPGMKLKAAKWIAAAWLLRHDTPLRYTPRLDPHQWRWLRRWLGECNAERYAANKARMGRIARYSHAQLVTLRERLGIAYQQTTRGNLQVFRDQAGLDNAGLAARVLRDNDVPHQLMNVDACLTFEPAMARETIAGGLLLPRDETGDCRMFTERLAGWLAAQGVAFRYATTVSDVRAASGRIAAIATSAGVLSADAYVVACASDSVVLCRSLGIALPVLPVKGFSVTVPIADAARIPQGGIMDEALKVAIAPMGNALRAAGTAQIGSNNATVTAAECRTPLRSLATLFPGAGELAQARYWAGLRPMTPDGAPLVGATSYPNLFLATGGGSNGWTTACGVGRLAADAVSGLSSEIDAGEFSVARFA
jgi:D-amino-acid dehydrogenase